MSMRITQSMMATNIMNNLSNDLQSMQTAENQESTGLAVTEPSDNPLATSQIMSLNTNISMQTCITTTCSPPAVSCPPRTAL